VKQESAGRWRGLCASIRRTLSLAAGKYFGVLAAAWLCHRLVLSYRRGEVQFWVDIGVLCLLCGLTAFIGLSSRSKQVELPRRDKAGIDVWMPLALLAAFVIVGVIIGIATAR